MLHPDANQRASAKTLQDMSTKKLNPIHCAAPSGEVQGLLRRIAELEAENARLKKTSSKK
jgi:hypothetical protein